MYFIVNFIVFFKLIKLHFLVSELYTYQNAQRNDKNCLSVGIIRIGQYLSASCKIVYRWVRRNCCFVRDILPENYLTRKMFL